MADIVVHRRRRHRRDGDYPTGAHPACDVIVATARTLAGSLHMARHFHFDAQETPTLHLICIDGEMARVVASAEDLKIDGLELLSELADAGQRAIVSLPGRCSCGNNPSPTDGYCRNCRPRARENGSKQHARHSSSPTHRGPDRT